MTLRAGGAWAPRATDATGVRPLAGARALSATGVMVGLLLYGVLVGVAGLTPALWVSARLRVAEATNAANTEALAALAPVVVVLTDSLVKLETAHRRQGAEIARLVAYARQTNSQLRSLLRSIE